MHHSSTFHPWASPPSRPTRSPRPPCHLPRPQNSFRCSPYRQGPGCMRRAAPRPRRSQVYLQYFLGSRVACAITLPSLLLLTAEHTFSDHVRADTSSTRTNAEFPFAVLRTTSDCRPGNCSTIERELSSAPPGWPCRLRSVSGATNRDRLKSSIVRVRTVDQISTMRSYGENNGNLCPSRPLKRSILRGMSCRSSERTMQTSACSPSFGYCVPYKLQIHRN
jgi:hypothetical protein